jgi:hypothetical protein
MNLKNLMRMSWVILAISIMLAENVIAQTRLGLHVTQEELDIWRQRATSGPYKSPGDVSLNSPGDWTKITNNALSTLSNGRFVGQTSNACVTSGTALGDPLGKGNGLRDAAFYYLVTGNLTVRTNAVNELLAQVAEPGTDFANSSRWCVVAANADNWFRTAQWLSKIIYAYDYILAGDQVWGQSLSSANKTTVETWILNGANYFEAVNHTTLSLYVQNRKSDSTFTANYTLTSEGTTRCNQGSFIPYYSGAAMKDQADTWNNRQTAMALPYGLAGILLNNATLKTEAKRYFTEWIRFSTYADGQTIDGRKLGEFGYQNPNMILAYGPGTWGIMAQVADAFARTGDTSLYDYTTSVGNCGTAGGNKNLLLIATYHSNFVDHTFLRYGTNNVANTSILNWLIDTNSEVDGNSVVTDHAYAIGNLYFQNTYLKSIYMRTAPGQNGYTVPGYPSSPAGSYYPWGGAWGVLPGVLFMWGQMEGKVRPYPTGVDLSPPTNLRIVTP